MTDRTLAIGDIHGAHVALETLLDVVQPTMDDTVVVLGDVVDRGPGTKQVVERLMRLRDECNLVFIKGNHEEMMLSALRKEKWTISWSAYGGAEAVASYGGDPNDIPESHLAFLNSGGDYHETDETIFIHANLEPGKSIDQQVSYWLRWTHLDGDERPHSSGKRIVCGHTRQTSGVPAVLDGWVCLDTFACGDGWLTCLDVESDIVHQANQAGETRGPTPLADIAQPFAPQ